MTRYTIRFEVTAETAQRSGVEHAYLARREGRLSLGYHDDLPIGVDGSLRHCIVPHRLGAEGTMHDTYEDAARLLLAWAMTCSKGGTRWVLNPQIREIEA